MGFYTSLMYYRPRPAPRIAPRDLSPFFLDLLDTGTLEGSGRLDFEMTFGGAIDQDDEPASWVEELGPGIGTAASITRDWTGSVESISELAQDFSAEDRTIYRAHISLGPATSEVISHVSRVGSPENSEDFVPDSWSLSLGPIMLRVEETRTQHQVGWMALCFHGNGYLYPWTLRDVVQRIENCEQLQKSMAVCRRHWPVPPEKPSWLITRRRRKLHDMWPYDDAAQPWDWYWGVE